MNIHNVMNTKNCNWIIVYKTDHSGIHHKILTTILYSANGHHINWIIVYKTDHTGIHHKTLTTILYSANGHHDSLAIRVLTENFQYLPNSNWYLGIVVHLLLTEILLKCLKYLVSFSTISYFNFLLKMWSRNVLKKVARTLNK